MKRDHNVKACLWDILNAANAIEDCISGMSFYEFEQSIKTIKAAERLIEIIGEAANRIDYEFRQSHPEINWKSLISLRNVITHEYDEIKNERIWLGATEDARVIREKASVLLKQLDDEEK